MESEGGELVLAGFGSTVPYGCLQECLPGENSHSCAECLCVECAGDEDSVTLQCHVSHKGQGGALLIGETTWVLGKFLWVQIPEQVLSNKILLAVFVSFPRPGACFTYLKFTAHLLRLRGT